MVARYISSFGGKKVLTPDTLHNTDENWPEDWAGRVNSYECPIGFEAGQGWVLMAEEDADELSFNSVTSLIWVDGGTTTTFSGLVPIRATKMTPSSTNRVVLVEFTDKRAAIRGTLDNQYNVRMPAPKTLSSGDNFYEESLNGGAEWTWQSMLSDMWGNLNSYAGSVPTLPYTPHDQPEMFRFIGVPAWQAIKQVLDKIGCTIVMDPQSGTLTIIRLGATQTGLAAAKVLLVPKLMFDYDPTEGNLWKAPATFRVFFHRKEEYHGIEKDTVQEDNWEMDPSYSSDVASGITGGSGIWPIWDDLPAMTTDTGSITNQADCDARAAEVAANMASRIEASRSRLHYSGIVTSLAPGSEVSSVTWRDYGDQGGTQTEIKYLPPDESAVGLHGIASPWMLGQDMPPGMAEVLEASGVGRASHPTYPRLPQMVRVTSATEEGTTGLWPATVERYVRGAWTTLDACWVTPIKGRTLQGFESGQRYIGRLAGLQEGASSNFRPVYVVDPTCRSVIVRFTLSSTLDLGSTASATILSCVSDTWCKGASLVGTSITVEDFSGAPGTWKSDTGKEGVAFWNGDAGCNYTILWVEEQAVFIEAATTSAFAGTPVTATATVSDSWQGYPPVAAITLEDKTGAYRNFPSGGTLIACYHDEDDVYVPIDPTFPNVEAACLAYGAEADTDSADIISFDKTWAHVQTGPGNFQGHVMFRRGSVGEMYWQGDETLAPWWTTCPTLATTMTIGRTGDPADLGGTLKLVRGSGQSHELQSNAGVANDEHHFWLLPESPSDASTDGWPGRYLVTQGQSGSDDDPCIDWKYSPVGWSGDTLVDKNDYTYEFTCGILTYSDNPDFEACTDDTTPTCSTDACVDDDPCA